MKELSNLEKKSSEVKIPIGPIYLNGNLDIPAGARGIVVLAYGIGSRQASPGNQYVAQELKRNDFGTLLLDLLTLDEGGIERLTRNSRFDVEMLSKRLIDVSRWLLNRSGTEGLNLGYFGIGAGAAAALIAARELADVVKAVVSRGGRLDIVGDDLMYVEAPTLFIVGGNDAEGIEDNQWAFERMVTAEKEIKTVQGANQFFEEQGAMEEVANLAGDWFKKYLR